MNTENISQAIMNKFQFNIKNETSTIKKLAILPAYLSIIDFSNITSSTDEVVTNVQLVEGVLNVTKKSLNHQTFNGNPFASAEALKAAGYNVDVVLHDGRVLFEDGKDAQNNIIKNPFSMLASNPNHSIDDFTKFVTLPRERYLTLKEMNIISNDNRAFATDMEFALVEPFKRNPQNTIDLNKFYSKYQQANDRIDITFDEKLELMPNLLWCINVPDNCNMQITLRF